MASIASNKSAQPDALTRAAGFKRWASLVCRVWQIEFQKNGATFAGEVGYGIPNYSYCYGGHLVLDQV